MTTHSFEFGAEITVSDIHRFLACPDNTSIVVWTMQQPNAVELLERTGMLSGDERYTFAKNTPGKMLAYEWLRQMMAKRLPHYCQEWPIWVSLTNPTPSDKLNDIILRMEIPKVRMLVSFYEAWVKLLGVMEHLEMHNNQWPEKWLLYREAPYLSPERDKGIENESGVPVPLPYLFDEQKCRSSWEQIFNLKLCGLEGFAWGSSAPYPLLQAVVPVIYREDVTATFLAPRAP